MIGTPGCSTRGGAFVSSSDWTRLNRDECGGGIGNGEGIEGERRCLFCDKEVELVFVHELRFGASLSALLRPGEVETLEGYSSNSMRSKSTISCRVATSPGFLSEYSRVTRS